MKNSCLRVLSGIYKDIAQIFFASVVVTPLFSRSIENNWSLIVIGLGIALVFWSLAVKMGERGKI
jgi:hypothetical protein